MVGDDMGPLKILFDRDTAESARRPRHRRERQEIIHVGQTVLAFDGSIEFFRHSVFNYPTFAETYKVVPLNGLNNP
jgi:NAD(P) transhydrogenase